MEEPGTVPDRVSSTSYFQTITTSLTNMNCRGGLSLSEFSTLRKNGKNMEVPPRIRSCVVHVLFHILDSTGTKGLVSSLVQIRSKGTQVWYFPKSREGVVWGPLRSQT